MRRKSLSIILIISIFAIAFASCEFQSADHSKTETSEPVGKSLLVKIAYDVAPTHSLHESFLDLEQWLEAESAGRIEVELYPLYELGDDADLLALTAEGVIQMTVPQTSSLASLSVEAPDEYPLDIPQSWQIWDSLDGFYRYDNAESAAAAVEGSLGAQMVSSLADLADQPFSCLGYAYEGPLAIGGTVDILSPADLAGQRMALYGSPAWLSAYQSLGAEVVVLPLSEIYPALAREQIDIYQATPENIATMHWTDYSNTIILTEHAYSFRPLLVNRQWYQSLSEEDAYLIDTAVDNLLSQQKTLAVERYQSSIDALKQQGISVHSLTPEEQELWRNY